METEKSYILLVEDNPGDARLIKEMLTDTGMTHEMHIAETLAEGIAICKDHAYDILLLDLNLPDSMGLETLQELKLEVRSVPVIVLTGHEDDQTGVEAMQRGAQDFLPKNNLNHELLRRSIEYSIERFRIHLDLSKKIVELHGRELELQLRENRFRNLIASNADAILVLDEQNRVLYTNPAAEVMLGKRKDLLVGYHFPYEVDLNRTVEIEIPGPGNTTLTAEVRTSAIDWEQTPAWLASLRDVTERKIAEHRQKLTATILRELNRPNENVSITRDILQIIKDYLDIDAAGIRLGAEHDYPYYVSIGMDDRFLESENSLIMEDMEGNIVYKEDGAPALACLCGMAVEGRTACDSITMTPGGSIWTNNADALDLTGAEHECGRLIAMRDAGNYFKSFAIIPLKSDEHTIGLLHLADNDPGRFSKDTIEFMESLAASIGISISKKNTQDALAESEKKYRLLIENLQEGVWVIDSEAHTIYANQKMAEMLGYEIEEMIGMHLFEFMDEKQKVKAIADIERRKQGISENHDFEFRHRDGRKIHTLMTTAPIMDSAGNYLGAIAGMIDVSDRVKHMKEKDALLQQLLHAQKMEAVGLLTGGIAHDFNNMLAVIMGNARLALKQLGEDDAGHLEMKEIMSAADRAKDLTSKLLTFARKEKLSVRGFPVEVVVQDLESMLARSISKKIEIVTNIESGMPPILIDVNQIHQAMLNICTNAADAMAGAGTLSIDVSKQPVDEDYCRLHENLSPGDYCRISVRDTGEGIPKNIIDKIFDPFFTTKEAGKGTGMGLSVTHGIITNHKGHIDVYSEPGMGTEFKIFLPFDYSGHTAPPPSDEKKVRTGDEAILVVDDEAAIISFVDRMLSDLGYRVITAGSGPEALDLYRDRQEHIDLVLLDIVMPQMDGGEVFEALKEINPDVDVVLSSGFSVDGKVDELMGKGVKGFVQKPFRVEELSNAIRTVLDR